MTGTHSSGEDTREHLGFRLVTAHTSRPNDLFVLPEWSIADESIPVETPPGVLRDPIGNPKLFHVPELKDDASLMDALSIRFRGEERRILVPEGAEIVETFDSLKLRFLVEGNSGLHGAHIRFLEIPAELMLVLKCGYLNCENLMAVPLSFWENFAVDLNLDTGIYPPDDSRSGFSCWDCWVPMHLRSDGLAPIDILNDEDIDAEWEKLNSWQVKVDNARAARPSPEKWFVE